MSALEGRAMAVELFEELQALEEGERLRLLAAFCVLEEALFIVALDEEPVRVLCHVLVDLANFRTLGDCFDVDGRGFLVALFVFILAEVAAHYCFIIGKNRSDINVLLDAHLVQLVSSCGQLAIRPLVLAHQVLHLQYSSLLSLPVTIQLLQQPRLALLLLHDHLLLLSDEVLHAL